MKRPTAEQLLADNAELRARLEEVEQTLGAIRSGDVDAVVVSGPRGEQIFSLVGAESIYRLIVETMKEAAFTVTFDGTILFCNSQFGQFVQRPMEQIVGHRLHEFVAPDHVTSADSLLMLSRKQPVKQRLVLWNSREQPVPVHISGNALNQPDGPSICIVATDLTELENSTDLIQQLRRQQEALRDSRIAALNLMKDAVETRQQTEEANENLRLEIIERQQAEEALKQSHKTFAELIERSPFGTYIVDSRFCIAMMNASSQEGAFRNVRPAIGRDFSEAMRILWPEPVAAEIIGHFRHTLDTGAPYYSPRFINPRHDAEIVESYEWELHRMTLPDGQYGVICYYYDSTKLREAEMALRESEGRFRALTETSSLAVGVSSSEGEFLYLNKAYENLFGYTLTELNHLNASELWRNPEGRRKMIEDVRSKGSLTDYEVELQRKDGTPFWAILSVNSVDYGGNQAIMASVYDITERKRAEEALRELNRTLESKVAQRTAELQHRAGQLQKLALELSETEDRERRQLAEILHDDLQQQLAAAKFHLSLLNSRAKHDPPQLAIVSQVDQMLMEAVQKSRSLSHELSPAVLYQGDFAGALTWLAGQLQTKHGLEVKVDAFGAVRVHSDALKSFLYKAAQELLFNVVKHARVNRARIRVRRLEHCICLSVSDQGRGFDPQDLRQTTGFGLLSIHERIELLGGRMKIHSVKGRGSTFHVVVPDSPMGESGYPGTVGAGPRARPMSEAKPDDHGLGGHGGPPLRVLLADDHAVVREGLISLLSGAGDIEVVGEAANGREAVDQAYRLQPDVILMDVAMPLINGDEATRQIKARLPQTRVIALSLYAEPDLVEKMRRAGVEGYLLKTAPAQELLAAIRGEVPDS